MPKRLSALQMIENKSPFLASETGFGWNNAASGLNVKSFDNQKPNIPNFSYVNC